MSTIAERHVTASPRTTSSTGLPENGGEFTRAQLQELAEATAREMLGVSAETAFAMLERGELEGSLAGGSLGSIRWLLSC
jgi:hypothetical protein